MFVGRGSCVSVLWLLLSCVCAETGDIKQQDKVPVSPDYELEFGYLHYSNYTVIDVDVDEDREKLFAINHIKDWQTDSFSPVISLQDVINPLVQKAHFFIHPEWYDNMTALLDLSNITWKHLDRKDVPQTIELWEYHSNLQFKEMHDQNGKVLDRTIPLNYFLTYEKMVQYLHSLTLYSDTAKVFNIGKTYEGRDMVGIMVNDERKDLPAIWIDAGIDPRKWITQATALYFLHDLIENEGEDAIFLRRNFRWYIVPNINPDGYVYTWTKDRFWRKTRSSWPEAQHPALRHLVCNGVDLKRNWDSPLYNSGVANPCSPMYRGPGPFSEVETRNVRDAILERKDDIKLYLSLQSHGQLITAPGMLTGYQKNEHYEAQELLANAAIKAMEGLELKRKYKFGIALETKYPIPGAVVDWVYHTKKIGALTGKVEPDNSEYIPGIKLALAIDLPPEALNRNNFLHMSDPPSQIYIAGEEFFHSMSAMCRLMASGVGSDVDSGTGKGRDEL